MYFISTIDLLISYFITKRFHKKTLGIPFIFIRQPHDIGKRKLNTKKKQELSLMQNSLVFHSYIPLNSTVKKKKYEIIIIK